MSAKSVDKMIVKELKEELEKRGLSTAGLKLALVTRLKEALEKERGGGDSASSDPSKMEESEPKIASTPEKTKVSMDTTSDSSATVEKTDGNSMETETSKKRKEPSVDTNNNNHTDSAPSPSTSTSTSTESSTPTPTPTPATPTPSESPKSTNTSESDNSAKRRRWGSAKSEQGASVSTDTLKDILQFDPESKQRDSAAVAEQSQQPVKKDITPTSPTVSKPSQQLYKRPDKSSAAASPGSSSHTREPVPPSTKPVSNVLYISGFVRPFTKPAAKELLEQTGKVVDWGMDNTRSKAYVIYETAEQATATREALHGLVWPATNKSRLFVDYSTDEEAKRRVTQSVAAGAAVAGGQQHTDVRSQRDFKSAVSTPAVPQASEKKGEEKENEKEKEREKPAIRGAYMDRERSDRERPDRVDRDRSNRDRDRDRDHIGRDRENGRDSRRDDRRDSRRAESKRERSPTPPAPIPISLDDLFRKTTCKPHIYYLPLNDEQVAEAAKKAAAEKEKLDKERAEREKEREKERAAKRRSFSRSRSRSRSSSRSRSRSSSRSRSPRSSRSRSPRK